MVSAIIIDDDQEAIESLTTYLRINDIQILSSANDGSTALELYEKYKPDFIITDYHMHEYDGLFVIESVKKFDLSAKIILLSAHATAEIKLQSLAFDSVNILEKPFDTKKLLELLE